MSDCHRRIEHFLRVLIAVDTLGRRWLAAGSLDPSADEWQHVWHTAGRLQFRRLNPLALSWNLARDTRHALLFFFALLSERY